MRTTTLFRFLILLGIFTAAYTQPDKGYSQFGKRFISTSALIWGNLVFNPASFNADNGACPCKVFKAFRWQAAQTRYKGGGIGGVPWYVPGCY